MDHALEYFKGKALAGEVEFLFLDGLSQKICEMGVEKKVILGAFAIHRKNQGEKHRVKEILSFQLAKVNNDFSWKGFPADRKDRRLLGKILKLIVTDGNPSLLKSIDPFPKGERCIAHKTGDEAVKIKRVTRPLSRRPSGSLLLMAFRRPGGAADNPTSTNEFTWT